MTIRKIAAGLIAVALLACVARDARAETPEQEQAAQDLREAKIVSEKHRDELMKIPHVTFVTAEIDPRNDAVILVVVDDQKNIDSVMRQVPSKLEGFPVEVEEGEIDDLSSSEAGHWGHAVPTPTPPTIDKMGIHHHVWLPATNPDPQQ